MTIDKMINELKHYVFCDLEELPVAEIVQMYNDLFGTAYGIQE